MNRLRYKVISAVLCVFMLCAPAIFSTRQARADLFGISDLISGSVLATQQAQMIAQLTSVLGVLGISTQGVSNIQQGIQQGVQLAQKVSTTLMAGETVAQCVQEVYALEQSIERYMEYASDNFGEGTWLQSGYIINDGMRYLTRATTECVGLVDAVSSMITGSNVDPLVAYTSANRILETIQTASSQWKKKVKEQLETQTSESDSKAAASLLASDGFLNPFQTEIPSAASLTDPRTMTELMDDATSRYSTQGAINANLVSANAKTVVNEALVAKNNIVNAVKILIGIVLLVFTVINLVKYFTGSFDQRFMSPLTRVILALVISVLILGLMDILLPTI